MGTRRVTIGPATSKAETGFVHLVAPYSAVPDEARQFEMEGVEMRHLRQLLLESETELTSRAILADALEEAGFVIRQGGDGEVMTSTTEACLRYLRDQGSRFGAYGPHLHFICRWLDAAEAL